MPVTQTGIVTAESYFAALRGVTGDPWAWYVSPEGSIGKAAAAQRLVLPALSEISALPPIPAHMNRGRWLVACPDCVRDYQFAWASGPALFVCTSCWNGYAGGVWRSTVIPPEGRAIEREALARPIGERSWLPGVGFVNESTSMAVYREALRG